MSSWLKVLFSTLGKSVIALTVLVATYRGAFLQKCQRINVKCMKDELIYNLVPDASAA